MDGLSAQSLTRPTGKTGSLIGSRELGFWDPARIDIGGEITAAWDRIEPVVRRGLSERALVPVDDTDIVAVVAAHHSRLQGAAALVGSTVFASAA